MQVLLSILAEGEEQARRLLLHDGDGKECCRAVAGQLGRTLGKAMAVAKAIQAAGGAASAGTDDRSDSPRSADESSAAQVQVQERQGVCKRRFVYMFVHDSNVYVTRRRWWSALFLLTELAGLLLQ